MGGEDSDNQTETTPIQDNNEKLFCLPSCKYERKRKHKNKTLLLTGCSFCMRWHHDDCIGKKDTEFTMWHCPSCRNMPNLLVQMLQKVDTLSTTMQSLQASQKLAIETLQTVKSECEQLRNQNKALQSQVKDLASQLNESSTSGSPSLLIGDSLLKDIDPKCLTNTSVNVTSGAKVTDILTKLKTTNDHYSSIIVCAGTNDCSDNNFSPEIISTTYRDIIKAAKAKVNEPKKVKISSIPPRSDSKEAQQRVEVVNASLVALAQDEGATYIDNDATFKLADGSPNDGYLLDDGIHLTFKGSNRLAKNLALKSLPECKDNVCMSRKRSHTKQRKSQHQAEDEHDGWQRVTSRRQRNQQKQHNNRDYASATAWYGHDKCCWFCGEENHVSNNCRHGQKIKCHICGILGHKAKVCSY